METKNNKKLVKFWKEAARKDLQTAVDIFDKTKNHVTVLFYIHLTIEKIIKAYYVSMKHKHAPYSHNLLYLFKESGMDISEPDKKILAEINEFNIECRYPDEQFLIYKKATRGLAKKYLKECIRMHEWISGTLKNGS
ncbi:MAG TPA: HEPN domain-containing protein [Spirochaetota bacterium]|nr:HEPN domain-containing protein [Spirochaetota bacterium]HPI90856.1 HEPN domain-containing protein [Spirochaetota bacterium]HPR49946.1 HEPN domain-containing protein [Spirochaetota bacterium]